MIKRKQMNQSKRRSIFNKVKGICQICGIKTRFFKSLYDTPWQNDVAGTVDHIIPISKGGSDEDDNLRWACRTCNCSRGARC